MDELEEKDFDPLAKDILDEEEEEDAVLVPGAVLPVKPVVADEEVDDLDALIDEEEEGVDDFGSEDYNAPDDN